MMDNPIKRKRGRPTKAVKIQNFAVRMSGISDEDIETAKRIASDKGTSLSAVLGKMMREYIRINREKEAGENGSQP